MKPILSNYKLTGFLLVLFYCLTSATYSTDNPDSPDYVGKFTRQVETYQKTIDDAGTGTRKILLAYGDYETFLDKELNTAYRLLMSKLPKSQQAELKASQQNWLKFRDAEFEFIKNNWTRNNFGSSAGLSRGAYRCSLIEARVLQLYHYVKNY